MKSLFAFGSSLFVLFALSSATFARGGGGCFEEGTLVLTPDGEIPIQELRLGDRVVGGVVRAVIRVESESYLELEIGGRILHVTDEHPIRIAPGVFREASRWKNARRIPATRPAYNLLVSPGGTFVANGSVVHNKGCFLPDTPILRADGSEVWIRDVKPGDELQAFKSSGEIVPTTVRNVLTHEVDEYLVVATERTTLRVTLEHPFYVGDGTFKTLEALDIGDSIFAFDGQGLVAQRIESISRGRGRVRVYNLQTDAPNTFFASRMAVHNKGGCFPAGTPVRTPRGEMPIELIRPGDEVLAGNGESTFVEAIFKTRAAVLTLITQEGTLRTTAEHPLLCADGRFRSAGSLTRGDRLASATIVGSKTGPEEVVYNLRVGGPHTFWASGFAVHNKGGGCFPAGVRIRTPAGTRPIESLSEGDEILAVSAGGRTVTTTVRHVYETTSPLLVLKLANGTTLRTTDEHPLALSSGEFAIAGGMRLGDPLRVWHAGRIDSSKIVSRHTDASVQRVFNLEVGAPHTFIADGVVVHNKGGFRGGGGRRYGSGRSSGKPGEFDRTAFFVIMGAGAAVAIAVIAYKTTRKDEDLDFTHSRSAIEKKADKTRKLLEFIARTDTTFVPSTLQQHATSVFEQLQKCWQAREYGPMQPLMMTDLYEAHRQQLEGMKRNHEINVLEGLEVESVDIVNVRYTHKLNEREFTALITAKARDFYIDDRTREFQRGDTKQARFQEFWTFQQQDGSWLLREIEQSRESDALKDENFFEQFTDHGRDQIYADVAGKEGPAGPWLSKGVEAKDDRIERMLNFLTQTDKMWNRQAMLQQARNTFTKVALARESGDSTEVPISELFPDVAKSLRADIESKRREGVKLEFRNLCVRKVDLILVQNYLDNSKDEFTTRISAHAQRFVKKNGDTVSADEYVTPFEEFWVFGRANRQWKLKEVLPPAGGDEALKKENLDEDSTPDQVEWYYKQTRAN